MRVLVVEDEIKMAALLRRGLSEEGLAVDVGSWWVVDDEPDAGIGGGRVDAVVGEDEIAEAVSRGARGDGGFQGGDDSLLLGLRRKAGR